MIVFAVALGLAAPPELSAEMDRYFADEVFGAQTFTAVGSVAVVGAAFMFASDSDEVRGAAGAMSLFALAELGIGLLIWLRTPAQLAALHESLAKDEGALRKAELSRMRGVNSFLKIVKAVELGLMAVGLGLAIAGATSDEPVLTGIGLGTLAQTTVMLSLDMFAAARGIRYAEALGE